SARNIPTEAARMAQPLRFGQIGLAALQFGGPLRHLRLELVVGFAKLLLALTDRFLDARRTKCGCRVIRGHGEQQLVDFGGKIGVITRRRDQPPSAAMPTGMTIPRHRPAPLPMSRMISLRDKRPSIA